MKTSIKKVGSYEAKTHLPSLLAYVARGKEIIITKRERPIARLIPIASSEIDKDVFVRIRTLHNRLTLPKGETTRDLINAGRRL